MYGHNHKNFLLGIFSCISGKNVADYFKSQQKFFVSDTSLIYAVMGYRDRMIAGILENIVMLELKRRGYKVYIGKLDDKEIDFIAADKL